MSIEARLQDIARRLDAIEKRLVSHENDAKALKLEFSALDKKLDAASDARGRAKRSAE